MNEQGRAAVLGWQQAVDTTFQRQSAMLAAPVPVDPDTGKPVPKFGITETQLRAIMPRLPADKARQYLPLLNQAMAEADIDTPRRQAAFLAQLAHESTELTDFEENGPPSSFNKRDGSMGNTQPGDGLRYKGRGPIQLTGRANYRNAGRTLGLDLEGNPNLVADPAVGFRTSAWYWRHGNGDLNPFADAGNFLEITHRINGGENGLAERERYYAAAKKTLGI